ncbi:MAG TPA: MBOAT family protein [Burkholderiales bacterium]|nr:MBOAT family protein [Burkholderiales bacterium]
MLFNSYAFILGFLPVAFFGFFLVARLGPRLAAAWLMLASFFFYGWWNAHYVGLLLLSVVFNFGVGVAITRLAARGEGGRAKLLLTAGLAADLCLLAYYKYANFFAANLGAVMGAHLDTLDIVLPLGISFFTFTQIAFLVDAYQGKAREYNFVHYGLFVSYFPHLIAGPILHHKEMMPQFEQRETYSLRWDNIAVGLTIFFIGLFKKTVLADGISKYVGPVFSAHASGTPLTLLDAWGGALAYTSQIYFDFSGYSDMAIGLSRLFGVKLPLNFDSPYKAGSIIDFWRRWHMTLSRFLRDYLYFPLGGNRKGKARRYLNLMVTMLLGGLWHGANWTFVLWGALHGAYLMLNHAFQALRPGRGGALGHWSGRVLTFLAVVVAWVFFRSENLSSAMHVLEAMGGAGGIALPARWFEKLGAAGHWMSAHGVQFRDTGLFGGGPQLNWIWICLALAWFAPNTQQIMARFEPALNLPREVTALSGRWWLWRPSWPWLAAGVVGATWAMLSISGLSEFIYFQF